VRQSCGNHRADARPWPGAGPAGLIPQPVEPQRCASGLLLQARKGLEALVQFGLHDVVLSTDLEQQKRLCRFSRQARGLRDHQSCSKRLCTRASSTRLIGRLQTSESANGQSPFSWQNAKSLLHRARPVHRDAALRRAPCDARAAGATGVKVKRWAVLAQAPGTHVSANPSALNPASLRM